MTSSTTTTAHRTRMRAVASVAVTALAAGLALGAGAAAAGAAETSGAGLSLPAGFRDNATAYWSPIKVRNCVELHRKVSQQSASSIHLVALVCIW